MRLVVVERVHFAMELIGGGYAKAVGDPEYTYNYEDEGELAFGYGRRILAERCFEADDRYKAARVSNQ